MSALAVRQLARNAQQTERGTREIVLTQRHKPRRAGSAKVALCNVIFPPPCPPQASPPPPPRPHLAIRKTTKPAYLTGKQGRKDVLNCEPRLHHPGAVAECVHCRVHTGHFVVTVLTASSCAVSDRALCEAVRVSTPPTPR